VRLIYLDTTIWNILAHQSPDEEKLCSDVSCANAQITLGLAAFYELMRTYFGTKLDAHDRGRRLFTCLRKFLAQRVPLLKTWEQLLVEEAENAPESIYAISPIENEQRFVTTIKTATKEMSSGSLRPEAEKIVNERKAINRAVGDAAAINTLEQVGFTEWLRSIQADQFGSYLDRESVDEKGQELLAKYLPTVFKQFGKNLRLPPKQMASALLSDFQNRTAHALVRGDIYRSWEFARRDGVNFRPCVPDDSYHVANASCCHFFVTEDRDGQADVARYAVPNIQALLYRREQARFSEWLPQVLSGTT
jgi:hypothetical protein